MTHSSNDYRGHPMLWIYGGIEKYVNRERLPDLLSTNNFIVKLEKLALGSDCTNIAFVPSVPRVFFTVPGNSKTIFSNTFADTQLERSSGVSRGAVKTAMMHFENNNFDALQLPGYNVRKLFTSGTNLFALVQDAQNAAFIIKIAIHTTFGFNQQRYIYNPINLAIENFSTIEVSSFSVNTYETAIVLLVKGNEQLKMAIFNHTKRGSINFQPIFPEIKNPRNQCTFKIADVKSVKQKIVPNRSFATGVHLGVVDHDYKNLIILQFDPIKREFAFKNKVNVRPKPYTKIDFFYATTDAVTEFKNNQFLEFLILFSEKEIDILNLDTYEEMPLIGQGTLSIDKYIKDKYHTQNLNSFKIDFLETGFSIPETGVFFGNSEQMYVILTRRSRNIWAAKPEQVEKDAKNHGNS